VTRDLNDVLSETQTSVRERERRLAGLVDGSDPRPIVLVGAGGLGRSIGERLLPAGARVVAYADNDPARQGSTLLGLPVISHAAAVSRYAPQALFVVAIWNGDHSFVDTHARLASLGCTQVEPWLALAWAFGDALLPRYAAGLPSEVLAARDDVLAQAGVWADSVSAEVYAGQVAWRVSGDFGELGGVAPDQYFPDDIVRLLPGEAFVDCGAYTGDTLAEFVQRRPDFEVIQAFEPDVECFASLRQTIDGLDPGVRERVRLHRLATANEAGVCRFAAGEGTSGAVVGGERGRSPGTVIEVPCAPLDDVVGDGPATFIKIDVEGAEAATLEGAAVLLRERRPLLAVSVYHRPSDLWELPRLVRALTDGYSLYLRAHRHDGFECVLYGVPAERRIG
jgi:FkbM family methyltransferase